jgi:hypothetical protein
MFGADGLTKEADADACAGSVLSTSNCASGKSFLCRQLCIRCNNAVQRRSVITS